MKLPVGREVGLTFERGGLGGGLGGGGLLLGRHYERHQ